MKSDSQIECEGFYEIIIEDSSDDKKVIKRKNTVLRTGRLALVKVITGETGTYPSLFITRIVFGTNGTSGGQPKFVDANRTGLFGPVVLDKTVFASIDTTNPSQAIFSTIVTYSDAVGSTLNEMALVLNDGSYYSMATFGDIVKTNTMQITFNWRINYI
jgi:hypothetical protein